MRKESTIFVSCCILLAFSVLLSSCTNRFSWESTTETTLTALETQNTISAHTAAASTTQKGTTSTTQIATTVKKVTTEVLTTSEYEGKDFSEYYFETSYNAWGYSPAGGVNIYRYPSPKSEVLQRFSNKKTIEVIGEYSDWYIVKVNENLVGFIRNYGDNNPLLEIKEFEKTDDINPLNLILIGTATTSSTIDSPNRATNLEISSNSASIVVKSGDTFSMNQATGPRTSAAGYKEAIVFVNGQSTYGLGGGVCQTTTTIHMAIKNAIQNGYNFDIIEANKHSKRVSYVSDRNDEAMVNWGSSDLRFVNNTGKDIAIKVTSENQTVTAEIYTIIIS